MSLRLVMMGTGTFALPTFKALSLSPHTVVGLFTQPDRRGRGHHNHDHPMKSCALEAGIPVAQPQSANHEDALKRLHDWSPDLCVVAAYGQILSPELLEIPEKGAINLHASLLPKYRGAAPIQYSILQGEQETGVTIFQIEPKLDAGVILGSVSTPIGTRETAGELQDRLAGLAVPLTLEIIDQLEAGTQQGMPQDPQLVTTAPRMHKSFGEIDWCRRPEQIDCHIRAMQPWPKPTTILQPRVGEPVRLQILQVTSIVDAALTAELPTGAQPGTVVWADQKRVIVQCQGGLLSVDDVQPQGKRRMTIEAFMCGRSIQPGDQFVRPESA